MYLTTEIKFETEGHDLIAKSSRNHIPVKMR